MRPRLALLVPAALLLVAGCKPGKGERFPEDTGGPGPTEPVGPQVSLTQEEQSEAGYMALAVAEGFGNVGVVAYADVPEELEGPIDEALAQSTNSLARGAGGIPVAQEDFTVGGHPARKVTIAVGEADTRVEAMVVVAPGRIYSLINTRPGEVDLRPQLEQVVERFPPPRELR